MLGLSSFSTSSSLNWWRDFKDMKCDTGCIGYRIEVRELIFAVVSQRWRRFALAIRDHVSLTLVYDWSGYCKTCKYKISSNDWNQLKVYLLLTINVAIIENQTKCPRRSAWSLNNIWLLNAVEGTFLAIFISICNDVFLLCLRVYACVCDFFYYYYFFFYTIFIISERRDCQWITNNMDYNQ